MIDRVAIYLLLLGCALFGAVIFKELAPAAGTAPAIEVPAPAPAEPAEQHAPGERVDKLVAETLARPLFSSSRRPPAASTEGGAGDSELSDTRLAGIMTEPGRRIAIFVPAGAKPLTVTEGDTVGGWRVESITPREVALTGPGGSKTLQPKIDPNLVPPPAQAASPPVPAAPQPAAIAARAPNQPAAVVLPPGFRGRPPVPPRRPGVLRGQR